MTDLQTLGAGCIDLAMYTCVRCSGLSSMTLGLPTSEGGYWNECKLANEWCVTQGLLHTKQTHSMTITAPIWL